MTSYERLERDVEKPKRVTDHSGKWGELKLLAETNGVAEKRVRTFCAEKHISFESLVELGTRVTSDRNGAVLLAWGYQSNGIVTAVKFRELGEGGKRYAAEPSVVPRAARDRRHRARSTGSSPKARPTPAGSGISSATSPRCSACPPGR